MTALATTASVRVSTPTSVEKLLLRAAHGLERMAIARMLRRSARAGAMAAQADAVERGRDRGVAVHGGLLPR
jgi:hypothetical protein